MFYKAYHDKIIYKTVEDTNLPKSFHGFTIFFISDIHRRKIRAKTIHDIKQKIDAVVIGGDLLEKGVPLNRVKKNIRLLKEWNSPIYFVWGNNDYEVNNEQLIQLFDDEHVIILADSIAVINRKNENILFLCLDWTTEKRDSVAINIHSDKYNILVSHAPHSYFYLNKEIKDKINLVLAGHTHGGQIRFFGIGPYRRGSFKKVEDTYVLISEGYGFSVLPFRLGTNAECHVLKLQNVMFNI